MISIENQYEGCNETDNTFQTSRHCSLDIANAKHLPTPTETTMEPIVKYPTTFNSLTYWRPTWGKTMHIVLDHLQLCIHLIWFLSLTCDPLLSSTCHSLYWCRSYSITYRSKLLWEILINYTCVISLLNELSKRLELLHKIFLWIVACTKITIYSF